MAVIADKREPDHREGPATVVNQPAWG
jgi:hypothetical protein